MRSHRHCLSKAHSQRALLDIMASSFRSIHCTMSKIPNFCDFYCAFGSPYNIPNNRFMEFLCLKCSKWNFFWFSNILRCTKWIFVHVLNTIWAFYPFQLDNNRNWLLCYGDFRKALYKIHTVGYTEKLNEWSRHFVWHSLALKNS